MSFNRRRWSNDFLDSLIDFQNKEDSDSVNKVTLFDSLDSKLIETSRESLENKNSIGITSIINSKDDSDMKSENIKSCNSVTNLRIVEDYSLKEDSSLNRLPLDDTVNTDMGICNDAAVFSEQLIIASSQNDQSYNLNKRLNQNSSFNTSTSDNEIINKCSGFEVDINTEMNSIESKCMKMLIAVPEKPIQLEDILNTNNKNLTDITLKSDNRMIQVSSYDSSVENTVQMHSKEYKDNLLETSKLDQRCFSSPLEFPQCNQELITEMNKPDIWDTLMALEQALSPVEDKTENFEECPQDQSNILNRLSQKFKQTPARFTEKLVSIIEDTVISSESPTKQNPDENSGISLHRMTGEFRKLCKFIEDESMPEWAPSLMNMTSSCFENIETPKYPKDNKNHATNSTNKLLKYLLTPKNKVASTANSPINRFTPTADKSFEYWESVCNMMCDSQFSANKNPRKSLCASEFSKQSMDEMLTICERQMASLDDSTIDIRSSEPYKKSENDMTIKNLTPRSKSESKIILNTYQKKKQSAMKDVDEKFNDQSIFDNYYESLKEYKSANVNEKLNSNESESRNNKYFDENIETVQEDYDVLKNESAKESDQEIFEKDFGVLYSPEKMQDSSMESSCNDEEEDRSLLIELAKRRQRCLDTAKLMMEIDREDPINNEDNKCIKTLYKLGIQDKTFNEVEDDTKFLNTLSQCMDYKNYISGKSKPLFNILSELNSPNDLKNKAVSSVKSVNLLNSKTPGCSLQSQQKCTLSKTPLRPKHNVTSIHSKKAMNKEPTKSTLKQTPKLEKKPPYLPNSLKKKAPHFTDLQQNKTLTKIDNRVPRSYDSEKIKATPKGMSKTSARTPRPEMKSLQTQAIEKTPQNVMFKYLSKDSQLDQKFHAKKLASEVVSPVSLKSTSQSDHEKVTTPKVTPKVSSVKADENRLCPDKSPTVHESPTKEAPPSPKVRLFSTPGKSPKTVTIGRKKPPTYFSDLAIKKVTPLKADYQSVKSPISLYINGTDTDLIKNIHGRINNRLLTPVSNGNISESPKLKFSLSSKENKSPAVNNAVNIILPTVRYQTAKSVHLINDKCSYSPSSLTPNSKTKKLLGPIENTVVIRHEGRVIDYNSPKSDYFNSETSIRVQKIAEKTPTRKKFI